jgi:cytochrome c-type biogenesis protein CcmH/NrfG
MAHPHTDDLYPPAAMPKRHLPWFVQLMVVFALLVLTVAAYALWNMGKLPTRTLELPTMERPANNPPEERPQRSTPKPSPLTPIPTPVTP